MPVADLHIVGDGIKRGELQQMVSSMGIDENVIFHGHLADPYPLLTLCDLLILPSLYEGMPNVLLEGMLCRIPVLATNTDAGAGEILRANPLGELVPTEDAEAIVTSIRNRFLQPEAWQSRREAAHRYVVENHSLKGWIDKMTRIFLKAAGKVR
jgi:glycosyltransferase involved in cell wall biosynthesis